MDEGLGDERMGFASVQVCRKFGKGVAERQGCRRKAQRQRVESRDGGGGVATYRAALLHRSRAPWINPKP